MSAKATIKKEDLIKGSIKIIRNKGIEELSARNLATVDTTLTNTINTYDILKYDTLVLTQDAVNAITEVYA